MELFILKNYISQYKKNKISIIKYWISDSKILKILKVHQINREIFVKKYALGILDYYIDIVNDNKKIGDCPVIDELVLYLKDKNITPSELFIICTGFKNALLEYTYDLKITNLQIEKEINYIFESNFAGVLDKYSRSILDVENELSKSSKIIDKNVIMSSTDASGKIISVSEAFCDISGYKEEELIGHMHNIVRHQDISSETYEELWKTIESGQVWKGELKNRRKDGSSYWVHVIITPNYDSNGNFKSYDAIRQDITSKKNLEEQQNILVEQSKSAAMGEMISMIAHQWRQPLQAVSILIQKLPLNKVLEGEISDELLDQVVSGIGKQLEYMSKTIDDFRDFFLPDKPKEKVAVIEVVNKALDFLGFMTKTDSIEVTLDSKTDIEIMIHVNELVQVFINLIKNARDVLIDRDIKERKLFIKFYEEEKYLVIEIEDNAGGIPEDILNKVFEPYFSTKSNKNGTGLGLYMCKTIIEKHSKGKLSVSNSENGAVFKIELPKENDFM
ncbi:PAS domain-containing sensor histidine kinase [Arcobacter sp. LA11]|uniref:PAS domain-containing sensor histidine kinase n=1 Tax=Arcobacter sp. LA11 TaxID=1898176 RepID=UPI000932FD70|nr:PAS domain-containing sensor histidine kinase [Arcobacter sp. LA11]